MPASSAAPLTVRPGVAQGAHPERPDERPPAASRAMRALVGMLSVPRRASRGQIAAFVRTVEHEAGGLADLDERDWGGWHMTPETVADLAKAARVKRVVLKHLVIADWVDDPKIAESMADTVREGYDGEIFPGRDGLKIEL